MRLSNQARPSQEGWRTPGAPASKPVIRLFEAVSAGSCRTAAWFAHGLRPCQHGCTTAASALHAQKVLQGGGEAWMKRPCPPRLRPDVCREHRGPGVDATGASRTTRGSAGRSAARGQRSRCTGGRPRPSGALGPHCRWRRGPIPHWEPPEAGCARSVAHPASGPHPRRLCGRRARSLWRFMALLPGAVLRL